MNQESEPMEQENQEENIQQDDQQNNQEQIQEETQQNNQENDVQIQQNEETNNHEQNDQTINNLESKNQDKVISESNHLGTQGEYETTTHREKQNNNKKLETEQQSKKVKTTTERSFKTLDQIYSKRNTQSMQFLRKAEQFDTKIVHEQINHSHSKQQYTFSKAQRFSKPKESYCSMQFYDSQIQTQLGKRAAALGYGNKSDFTKKDKYIPGPTEYNVKLPSKTGVKFAYGRAETSVGGIHGRANPYPAPNCYQVKDIVTQIKYSLGERTNARHIYIESTTPAPGKYNIGGFSTKGNYFIGKYKSSGAPVIAPQSAQSNRPKRFPGPGTYDPPGDIGDIRTYLPSNYSTRSGYRFGYQDRQTQEIRNKQYPGPGTYQLPSEFGDFEYPPLN